MEKAAHLPLVSPMRSQWWGSPAVLVESHLYLSACCLTRTCGHPNFKAMMKMKPCLHSSTCVKVSSH